MKSNYICIIIVIRFMSTVVNRMVNPLLFTKFTYRAYLHLTGLIEYIKILRKYAEQVGNNFRAVYRAQKLAVVQ